MAFTKPKINTNWLLFVLAIALGLGAVYLSNSMMKQRMAQIEEEGKRGSKTVEVVVAKRDLQRGDALTGEVVAVRQMPEQYVHAAAIRPDQFASIENQRLAFPMKRGDVLLPAHSEGNGLGVFSATLKKGSRALTFEVDSVNSISGMLRPGDRIDLIYKSKGDDSNSPELFFPLMSNVTVLATDQLLSKRDEQGKTRTFSTITLEVSPLDANRIIVAKASGSLTAVLRHPDDEDKNDTTALTAAQLVGGFKHRAAEAPLPSVEYIVGGGGGGPIGVVQQNTTPAVNSPPSAQANR